MGRNHWGHCFIGQSTTWELFLAHEIRISASTSGAWTLYLTWKCFDNSVWCNVFYPCSVNCSYFCVYKKEVWTDHCKGLLTWLMTFTSILSDLFVLQTHMHDWCTRFVYWISCCNRFNCLTFSLYSHDILQSEILAKLGNDL